MSDTKSPQDEVSRAYQNVVKAVRKTVKRPLTDEEAHEAARNMIEFYRLSLAIHRRMTQDSKHDKHS